MGGGAGMRTASDLTFLSLLYYIVYSCPVKNGALTFVAQSSKTLAGFY